MRKPHPSGEDVNLRPVAVSVDQWPKSGRRAAGALEALAIVVDQTLEHVVVLNCAGEVEFANRAAIRDRHCAPGEACTKASHLCGLDDDDVRDALQQLTQTRFMRRTIEREYPDGSHVEEMTVWPLRDGRGKIKRLVVVSCDMTEQLRAQETAGRLQDALRTAASEWRHTVDAIEWPILLFDRPATIRRMNRAARNLLGRDDYGLVGTNLQDLEIDEPWRTIRQLVGLTSPGVSETHQVFDAGSGRTWEITASLASPDAEFSSGVIVVVRDISAMLRMQDSLRRSETMSAMGQLLAGVAHEVKNPLFGISATLDAMIERFKGRSEYLTYTAMLGHEVDRLKALMRDLLDFGRPADLQLKPLNLGAVVGGAVALVLPAAITQSVEIDNRTPLSFGACLGDQLKLQQAFRNLFENALYFSPRQASITIESETVERERRSWHTVRVRDRGPGFDASILPRLFQPFLTRRPGGTGLGLSVVQRTVEAHGGRVLAANHAAGGAVLTVELPARGLDD